MTRILAALILTSLIPACANLPRMGSGADVGETPSTGMSVDVAAGVRPRARPAGLVARMSAARAAAPPAAADTAAEFDTVSAAEKAAATAPAPVSATLGTTVASLGSPAEPGLWLKTPLVSGEQAGRVAYGGKSVAVTLIPIDGPATAGSRMSLSAFQTLGAPLTDLVEVEVFRS